MDAVDTAAPGALARPGRGAPTGRWVLIGMGVSLLAWLAAFAVPDVVVSTLVADAAGALACGWALVRGARQEREGVWAPRAPSPMESLCWVVAATTCWVGGQLCYQWLVRSQTGPDTGDSTGWRAWVLLLTAVVVAPVFEELLCRGLLQRHLVAAHGAKLGVLGTTAFFVVMHLDPHRMVHTAMLGLLLSLLALRSGRMWVTMAVHTGYNLISLTVPVTATAWAVPTGLLLGLVPTVVLACALWPRSETI